MSTRTLRTLHRYLGLITGIQLLLWTLSGLYFTLIPINEIRGDHLLNKPEPEPAKVTEYNLLSPSQLNIDATTDEIRITTVLGRPVYIVKDKLYSAHTGHPFMEITKERARDIVKERTDHEIVSIELIEEVNVDSEYRGGPLPAWKVTIDHENAAIWVDKNTGRLRAVRTTSWRLFDFLWSLHIMDYEEREDFNHLLIQFLAVLGLITVLSGLVLFFTTARIKRNLSP